MTIQLDYCPFPYQLEAHTSGKRFSLVLGGRRVGKSDYAIHEIITHAINTPHGLSWYVAPTYADAKEIGWEKFLEHYDKLEPAIRQIHRTKLIIYWTNGHKTFFKGAENDRSLRGRGLTKLVLDECDFIKERVWFQILRPALSDRHGSAILITTPNGRNWVYRLWAYANNPMGSPYWYTALWPTSYNPLISDEEIEQAKDQLSELDFRQEYLAEFITKAGMVYDDFSDDNIIQGYRLQPNIEDYYLGIDFGFANPSAVLFIAVRRDNGQVIQFDEIYQARTGIEQLSNMIKDKCRMYGININRCYTDPAGNAEELSSGISPVDYLRREGFTVENKGSEISPGLALVRSYIKNMRGIRKFSITDNCVETIRSLYGYTYAPMSKERDALIKEEPLKDGLHDHACDALRYFFVNRFDHAKYVASTLDEHPYTKQKRDTNLKRCMRCRKVFISSTPKTMPPFMCDKCLQKDLTHDVTK